MMLKGNLEGDEGLVMERGQEGAFWGSGNVLLLDLHACYIGEFTL